MVWECRFKIKFVKFHKRLNDIYPLNEYLFTQISLKSFPMVISEVDTYQSLSLLDILHAPGFALMYLPPAILYHKIAPV